MTTPKKTKEEAAKARAEKTAEVLAMLAEGVEALKTGADWARMLAFRSKFYDYSFRNFILIAAQCPGASHVAGFNHWKKLGRSVRKGEKGIKILAPLVGKKEQPDGAVEKVVFGFRVAYVFDISQTDGTPVPSLCREIECTDAGRADAAFDCLRSFSEKSLGLPVSYEVMEGDVHGYLHLLERRIAVSASTNAVHQAKTLAHELGHALLHLDSDDVHGTPEKEVEAESVAFCVMTAFGFDTSSYSFGYVAGWSGGDSSKVIASADRISGAVKRILASTLDVEETEQVAA